MYVIPTAAHILGVTPEALRQALVRGETIATLTTACGLDLDLMIMAVSEAELADIDALAFIAGFDAEAFEVFAAELRGYVTAFVLEGEAAADARFDQGAMAAA